MTGLHTSPPPPDLFGFYESDRLSLWLAQVAFNLVSTLLLSSFDFVLPSHYSDAPAIPDLASSISPGHPTTAAAIRLNHSLSGTSNHGSRHQIEPFTEVSLTERRQNIIDDSRPTALTRTLFEMVA